MKCFYHLDLDGKCAGFLVWTYACTKLEDQNKNNFIKINYGMEFPLDKIEKDEKVFIVDFSIEPDNMRQLLKITKNVVWIDHHISTIEKYKDFEEHVPGIRMTGPGISGASLTYWYLGNVQAEDGTEIVPRDDWMDDLPLTIRYVADWDTWTFDLGMDTKYFHTAFDMYEFEPWEYGNWWDMMHNPQRYVTEGKLLYRFKQRQAEEYVRSKGFAVEFEGHKAFAVNHGLINSDFFGSVDDGSYDMFIGFSYNGGSGKWSYSLRAAKDDIDVSNIAVKYGGGGHKGAAGFTINHYVLGEMDNGKTE